MPIWGGRVFKRNHWDWWVQYNPIVDELGTIKSSKTPAGYELLTKNHADGCDMLWIGKSFNCRFQKHLPDRWETGSTACRVRSAQERSSTMGRKLWDVSGDPRWSGESSRFLAWHVIEFIHVAGWFKDISIWGCWLMIADVDMYPTVPWMFWRFSVAFTLFLMCWGGSVTLLVWNILEDWPFGRYKRVVHTVFPCVSFKRPWYYTRHANFPLKKEVYWCRPPTKCPGTELQASTEEEFQP